MNSETPWLNIPAAKIYSNYPVKNAYALSTLNYITAKLSSLQGTTQPYIDKTSIILFIADHGVVIDGKTSLAKPITYEKIKNIINKKSLHPIPKIELINLGTQSPLKQSKDLVNARLGLHSENFCCRSAMSREQLAKAINLGRQTAQRIKINENKIFIAREVNDANILSATAIAVALLDIKLEELPFLDHSNKKLISQAITTHKTQLTSPIEITLHLGSFEMAALIGSYLCCAHMGLPVLVDDYTSTVAAYIVSKICPTSTPWFLFSQPPSNIIHSMIHEQLKVKPLLQNNQGFKGASGITSALSLIHLACKNHNDVMNLKKISLSEKKLNSPLLYQA